MLYNNFPYILVHKTGTESFHRFSKNIVNINAMTTTASTAIVQNILMKKLFVIGDGFLLLQVQPKY